jgi:hypothetical protein
MLFLSALELAVDHVGDEGHRGDRVPARCGPVRGGHPRTLPPAAAIRRGLRGGLEGSSR